MTTEVEIFKKYKPTEDGWISNTKFRQAIHDAYSAGKADGVYLLDKALATKGAMATDAYEKTLRNAYTETNVKDTEAYKMGYADGDWANYYAKHKGSAPSIYDEAEAQVKQKISQAIFGDIEKGYHICENEEWCCRQCVEGEDIPCPCWIALKAKYLKAKP